MSRAGVYASLVGCVSLLASVFFGACGGRTGLATIMTEARDASFPDGGSPVETSGAGDTVEAGPVARVGRWLVFGGTHTAGAENDQLFAALLGDGIGPLQVLAEDVRSAAEWSADGRFLAFTTKGELRVLEHVGNNLVLRQTFPATDYAEPHWSPVAPVVAWTAPDGIRTAMVFADIGRGATPVTVKGEPPAKPIRWSADGVFLVSVAVGPLGSFNALALTGIWEEAPTARTLAHTEGVDTSFPPSMSLDGKYIEYRDSNGDLWVAPLLQPDAAVSVAEVVWLTGGGFAEKDPQQGASQVKWTGEAWDFGPWTRAVPQATYVSKAGRVAGSCPDGFCVGWLGDESLGTWYAGALGISEFSPDGQQLIAQENVLPGPQHEMPFPAMLQHLDLRGPQGNMTKIADFQFNFGSFSTTRRWSPSSDAFVVMLEGGTAGVLAWRVGDSAGTWLAQPNPRRYRDSTGAWAVGGRDLAMAWSEDDGASDTTNIYVFRIDHNVVVDQTVFAGLARPYLLGWYWQP
jgi:hypothetical protein